MLDYKKVTPWYFAPSDSAGPREVFHIDYGFTAIRGNRGPYFSMTHECYVARPGNVPLPTKREVSFGIVSASLIDAVPLPLQAALRTANAFHLFDPISGPMHYEANGLYWLAQAAGEYDDGPSYLRPREGDPDPWKAFLRHVAMGQLSEDQGSTNSLRRTLTEISVEGRKLWLRNRLPLLKEAFAKAIMALDLDAELAQAQAFFAEQAS